MKQKSGMFLWKFIGFFTVSYLILSIPFNNRALFEYSYELTSPATKPVFAAIKISFVEGWEAGQRFTKKLFSNSLPSETAYIDKVGSKLAAPEKNNTEKENNDPVSVEEQASLEKALQD